MSAADRVSSSRDVAVAASHGAESVGTDALDRLARLRTFHTLDALRGVAAISVVLFHAAFVYGVAQPAEGQVAVDLFFVMSGFIIAHRYEGDLRGGMTLAHFTKLRLIRLYPLFFLGMVLGVIPPLLAVLANHRDAAHLGLVESFPLALLMLPSRLALPSIQEIYPLNYVAWSLALELVVNIAYGATVRFWTIRRLALLLAVALLGLCACAMMYGRLKGGYNWYNVYVGIFRVLYGFGAGVLLCRLTERKPFRIRVPWWMAVGAACALFVVSPPIAAPLWEIISITLIVPAIVAVAVTNEPPLALRTSCAAAGVYSYAVYSLHAPLIGFFLRGETRAHIDVHKQTPIEALAFTVLLAVACVAAHRFYDKPVRRYLSARLRAGRPQRLSSDPIVVPPR